MAIFFKTNQPHAYYSTSAMEAETIQKKRESPKIQKSRENFIRKSILTLIGIVVFSSALAQDYTKDPQANEQVIGNVTEEYMTSDNQSNYTEAYTRLLRKAQKEYPNKVIDIRSVKLTSEYITYSYTLDGSLVKGSYYKNVCSAKVIEFISHGSLLNETLVKALDKAMSKVYEGSRVALDQLSVSGGGMDRETVKDQLVDILLDRGYRVVAKEYLERVRDEQEEQQSGGYNEKKTVKTDNLSGVGYFLNVRVTEKSIRVQVINVSTGEYEGNATVDF